MQRYLKGTSLPSDPITAVIAIILSHPEGFLELSLPGKVAIDPCQSVPHLVCFFTPEDFNLLLVPLINGVIRENQTLGSTANKLPSAHCSFSITTHLSALKRSVYLLSVLMAGLSSFTDNFTFDSVIQCFTY